MGYTIGGLRKNGKGSFSRINHVVQTSRVALAYDLVVSSSPTTNCEIIEESSPVNCDKHVDFMATNVIPNENFVAPNIESKKNNELSAHPHQKKLPKHHHSWSITSLAFRSLQKICERINHGPMSTIKIVCVWANG